MFSRILIANRGEIACRIIRGCHELGSETVAVYSDPDKSALHVKRAGHSVHLGPAAPSESYLNQEKIIAAAKSLNCDAIHPGYGFLAENAEFAEAVMQAGITWIGPPSSAIREMGLKIEAREQARLADAPMIPGFEDAKANDEEFLLAAQSLGYPVMVKASAGGGGKGMRLVESEDKLVAALAAARRESAKAFGNDTVYLEKFIINPRHIEIQVLADIHGNCVHLGERECSIQRRHQKVVEETPSTVVDRKLRDEMGSTAVAIAQQVDYVGAGTVEFIVDTAGNYYFLEMNTRLQVEHPVTELTYGVDLVHWQLRIAAGEKLDLDQAGLTPRGHAIEVRVCSEDPAEGFLPAVGTCRVYREPSGPGVRLDTMLYEGWEVGADYDPLLGKLIVWGADRTAAIARLKLAISNYQILGVQTNLAFLHAVVSHPAFAAGQTTTGFIDENFKDWDCGEPDLPVQLAAVLAAATSRTIRSVNTAGEAGHIPTPWQTTGAWSNV